MKRITCSLSRRIAALGGIALVATFSASGQVPRFYVTGGVGPAFTSDTGLREFDAPLSGYKVKFDTGVQLRIAGGFRITEWLSTELEAGATYNNIQSITGATEVDASLSNYPLMANLVFQCPRRSRLTPYIGGGLGGSASILSADDIVIPGAPNGTRLSGTQGNEVFAYHGFGGLRYNITDRMGVSVAYNYFGTTAPTWEADIIFPPGTGKTRFGDNQTHSVMFSFTYSF